MLQQESEKHGKNNKETAEIAKKYIEDALYYLSKTNSEKYNFQITKNGLKYGKENKITNKLNEITNQLAKLFCDDYYYTINMPIYGEKTIGIFENEPAFSDGTQDYLNENRHQRKVHYFNRSDW